LGEIRQKLGTQAALKQFQNILKSLKRTLVFQLDWIVISRSEDENHKNNLTYVDSLSSSLCRTHTHKPHTHTHRQNFRSVPLYTGLLEKWEFQIISVMKLKLQDTSNPGLNGHYSQPKDRRLVTHFFNTLEKVVTEMYPSDTPGNPFNADDSGIQINKNTCLFKLGKLV